MGLLPRSPGRSVDSGIQGAPLRVGWLSELHWHLEHLCASLPLCVTRPDIAMQGGAVKLRGSNPACAPGSRER